MAERPVFLPTHSGPILVLEKRIGFFWHAGMAPSQKRKNIVELHLAAGRKGLSPILEVSSKSELEIGRELSAFRLPTKVNGVNTTVECAYQGSKVFERGGPYTDIYSMTSREAKGDERIRNSGPLKGFLLEQVEFPLFPPTAFYDWLYLNALYREKTRIKSELGKFVGFTDIEFNPDRSLNCQAKSCAMFFSLDARGQLDDALESPGSFLNAIQEEFA